MLLLLRALYFICYPILEEAQEIREREEFEADLYSGA